MKRIFLFFFLLSSIAVSAQTKTIVYFTTAESTLWYPARKTLDSLAVALKNTGSYHLIINGYCDSTGIHPGNITLGKARANVVLAYLKDHGVVASKMVSFGFAESDPAASGSDDMSLAKNRRVEILIKIPDKTSLKLDANTSLSDLEVGQKLVLKDLNFENNAAILLPESVPVIRILLKLMDDNPTLAIKLSGHVCCTDDMSLSVARARFVYTYLSHHGIDSTRMAYEGFSNRMPLLPNDDTDLYAAKVNRRVEITVVKK